jgi:hypothetical protein
MKKEPRGARLFQGLRNVQFGLTPSDFTVARFR